VAQAAVDRAPAGIRPDLANVFYQLNDLQQARWAALILDTDNPCIDEVAFAVAHTSTVYLGSEYSYPELFTLNAEMIYTCDEALDYVQVVDTGAYPDDDYWSTTRYTRVNENGEVEQVDVPRDVYYWYLVMPKITDDIPTFIDPEIVENNATHVNNISGDGVFWRQWFWTNADEGYPLLADSLAGVQYLWSRDGTGPTAIGRVMDWINDSMEFTSNAERPHQPVRIYRKHIGRCGEHADITAAAARTALIPCTSILAMSSDHTWNEFWESEWIQWEPVNGCVNNPLVYENGWGKVFGSVFEIRSDGDLSEVTPRYSEGIGTLEIHVQDALGRPVDGARIVLAITGNLTSDMVGFTNSDGVCTLLVGDAQTYYMRVNTALGNYPEEDDTFALLVENMPVDGYYTFQATVAGVMPWPDYTEVAAPEDPTDDYRFAVEYEQADQVVSGIVTWDDIDEVGTRPLFYRHDGAAGSVNWFVATSDNFMFYQLPIPFEAVQSQFRQTSGADEFDIPATANWTAWLDNGCAINNPQYVTGSLQLWHWGINDVNDDTAQPVAARLLGNHPNPFNPTTEVAFSLAAEGRAQLVVYDIRGRRVRTLADGAYAAGEHTLVWDGRADSGAVCATGVYLLRLDAAGATATQRMLMLK